MNGKTILLVEDDRKVMRNNIMILESRGATVLTAATLAEAKTLLFGDPASEAGIASVGSAVDAVVLDIMLPDGSGLDLLKEIRTDGNLPVLVLTAKQESNDIVTVLSFGADDYLSKPYDLNVFTARINALLRRAQTAGKNITSQEKKTMLFLLQ